MERRFLMLNDVSDVEKYIDYVRRQYNSEFRVEYPYTLQHLEWALEKYEVCLWNYPLCEMDYVAYECDHDLYAIVKFPTENGFEHRICEC